MLTITSPMTLLKMTEMNYIESLTNFIENILGKVFFLVTFIKPCHQADVFYKTKTVPTNHSCQKN